MTDTHYHIPRWLRGRNFKVPMQAAIQKKKTYERYWSHSIRH